MVSVLLIVAGLSLLAAVWLLVVTDRQARERLADARRPERSCERCEGTGREVIRTSQGRRMMVTCGGCNGKGTKPA